MCLGATFNKEICKVLFRTDKVMGTSFMDDDDDNPCLTRLLYKKSRKFYSWHMFSIRRTNSMLKARNAILRNIFEKPQSNLVIE